jgi:hypothetical protein
MTAKKPHLTEAQKKFIDAKASEEAIDYIVITNLLFEKTNIAGSSREAKLVRDYLIGTGKIQKKGVFVKKPPTESLLTKIQCDFIDTNIVSGLTVKQITELLFHDALANNKVQIHITPEYRAVYKYIKVRYPEYVAESTAGPEDKYTVPRVVNSAVKKVNDWCSKEFKEEKLTTQERRFFERLVSYLSSPRFIQVINSYPCQTDKEIFEAEFVRSTWDKPDLTIDEINLYINVCMDYINLKQVEKQKSKLNEMLDNSDDQQDLTMKLTEILKTKSDEYNQCVGRIDKALTKLNGDRAKRIEHQIERTANILSVVQAFQQEDGRQQMILMAEMQNKLVGQESDRLESMPAWKARILGISKGEAI